MDMQLSFKIISSPGETDLQIRDFIAANDNDFFPTITSRRTLEDFVQSVYVAKGKYVICYDGDRIVALTSVYLDHPSFITYYHYVAVDKGYRGRGISTTLYNYMHEICREHGVQWAVVKTWSTNLVSQAMFKKHGFFHLYTIEDDRSKGVHTYFYAKSFSEEWFWQPLTGIGIVGGGNNYILGNFVKTISSIPKTNAASSLPFLAVSDNMNAAYLEGKGVSHLVVLDPQASLLGKQAGIEAINLAAITKKLVEERNKKFLMVGEGGVINNGHIPNASGQKRIKEVIEEIRTGKVSPAYHKNKIAEIAVLNNCDGVVLVAPELHTMFGFDKMFNGVEIFDPLLELAIIIQNNRMKKN